VEKANIVTYCNDTNKRCAVAPMVSNLAAEQRLKSKSTYK
jgi:hypothetical protein